MIVVQPQSLSCSGITWGPMPKCDRIERKNFEKVAANVWNSPKGNQMTEGKLNSCL